MAYMSVSELNNKIKSLLETTFMQVIVEGEISNITYHSSGHIYFSLKDKEANIKAVMFKGNTKSLKFRLENGLNIIATGAITLYAPRGEYQIVCSKIEPQGEGALALAYEQLKNKLEQKGYFDKSIKKPIPKFVNHIAIVTSKTGAAIEDMLKVAQNRWKLVKITLIDTIVQGEASANNIAKNIQLADMIDADVIVIGRGGGSKEDLWAFNEEIVADAIYRAKTPIVSAVGHEIDYMISDFVADLRAPTPSASMQMILPDQNEYMQYLDDLVYTMNTYMQKVLDTKSQQIQNLQDQYNRNSIEAKLKNIEKNIVDLKVHYNTLMEYKLSSVSKSIPQLKYAINQQMQSILTKKDNELILLKSTYNANKPIGKIKKGFAQISKANKIISLDDIKANDEFVLQDDNQIVQAKAIKTKKLNTEVTHG